MSKQDDAAAERPKRRMGFAVLPAWRRREIASLGGYWNHKLGKAHEWTSEEARAAGAKGGKASKARRDGAGQERAS